LNARGLELSATDLLKNYLFSQVKVRSDLDALQRRWRMLVNTVRQERFPEFLRYHLLCEMPKIRTQRLFKIVRDRIDSPHTVFKLISALEERAELFAALSDPNHEYWIDRPECMPHVRDLRLFRVRQMTPLLFAAWEKFTRDDFEKVLRLVAVLSFRYTVVAGLNTNELEPMSHAAAKSVLLGDSPTPAAVFATMRTLYVDDERFVNAFSFLEISTQGQKRKLAKYILCALESDAGRNCDPDTDSGTIEHILPENPGAEWEESIPREHFDKYAYRLGNLTLLEPNLNRAAGNASYAEKAACYARSEYRLTSLIMEHAPAQWSIDLINARQKIMAQRAAHIWRSVYA